MARSVNSVKWQGLRAGNNGIVVYYDSDKNSELPIRAMSAKKGDTPDMDPNYETKTYGFYGCNASKLRAKFIKKKFGYIFFMTRYQGTDDKYDGKLMITGYYKVNQNFDAHKQHLRHIEGSSCQNSKTCMALRSNDAVFLTAEDSYLLTTVALRSLGYDKKVTRMTKLEIDDEQVAKVLKKFQKKENAIAEYVEETKAILRADEDNE